MAGPTASAVQGRQEDPAYHRAVAENDVMHVEIVCPLIWDWPESRMAGRSCFCVAVDVAPRLRELAELTLALHLSAGAVLLGSEFGRKLQAEHLHEPAVVAGLAPNDAHLLRTDVDGRRGKQDRENDSSNGKDHGPPSFSCDIDMPWPIVSQTEARVESLGTRDSVTLNAQLEGVRKKLGSGHADDDGKQRGPQMVLADQSARTRVADAGAELADAPAGRLYPANRDFSEMQDKLFIINVMASHYRLDMPTTVSLASRQSAPAIRSG